MRRWLRGSAWDHRLRSWKRVELPALLMEAHEQPGKPGSAWNLLRLFLMSPQNGVECNPGQSAIEY